MICRLHKPHEATNIPAARHALVEEQAPHPMIEVIVPSSHLLLRVASSISRRFPSRVLSHAIIKGAIDLEAECGLGTVSMGQRKFRTSTLI